MEDSLDHNISGLMEGHNGVEDSLDHNISGLMVWKFHSTTIFQV